VFSTSCSLTFVTPPPPVRPGVPRPHVDCTTSHLWPIVDTALAVYEVAGVAYVSTLEESRFRDYPISKQGDLALGTALAVAFAGSAVYGYVSAARCRSVQRGPGPTDYLPGVSTGADP
jgi:hypothetical protein